MKVHNLQVTRAALDAIERGETIDADTDGDMCVVLGRAGNPVPDLMHGVSYIPVGNLMRQELLTEGRSGYSPNHSPYVFDIALR